MDDRVRADVARRAVADAVARVERLALERPAAVLAVAEAQHRRPVVLGLDDEARAVAGAVEQVARRGASGVACPSSSESSATAGDAERRAQARGRRSRSRPADRGRARRGRSESAGGARRSAAAGSARPGAARRYRGGPPRLRASAVVDEDDVAARDADVRHAERRPLVRAETESVNGSASSACHSISVIGASSSGSIGERRGRQAHRRAGAGGRRRPARRSAGSASSKTSTAPAARSGCWPRSVARVARAGRQQRSSPQVWKNSSLRSANRRIGPRPAPARTTPGRRRRRSGGRGRGRDARGQARDRREEREVVVDHGVGAHRELEPGARVAAVVHRVVDERAWRRSDVRRRAVPR